MDYANIEADLKAVEDELAALERQAKDAVSAGVEAIANAEIAEIRRRISAI